MGMRSTSDLRKSAQGWRFFVGLVAVLGLIGAAKISYDAAQLFGSFDGNETDWDLFFTSFLPFAIATVLFVGIYFLQANLLEGVALLVETLERNVPGVPPPPPVNHTTPAPPPKAPSPPTPESAASTPKTVPPEGLLIRAEPDASLEAIERIPSGMRVTVLKGSGAWANVRLGDGREVWLDGQRLIPLED